MGASVWVLAVFGAHRGPPLSWPLTPGVAGGGLQVRPQGLRALVIDTDKSKNTSGLCFCQTSWPQIAALWSQRRLPCGPQEALGCLCSAVQPVSIRSSCRACPERAGSASGQHVLGPWWPFPSCQRREGTHSWASLCKPLGTLRALGGKSFFKVSSPVSLVQGWPQGHMGQSLCG